MIVPRFIRRRVIAIIEHWAFDTGAFADWHDQRPWDEARWLKSVTRIATGELGAPDFAVIPDEVASPDSLAFSLKWLERIEALGWRKRWPWYFAAQDGMTPDVVPWDAIDGLFVGGTDEWKRRTAQGWVEAAHEHGMPCHYARCGTALKVSQARAIGADSLDSNQPLWSESNLRNFRMALEQPFLLDTGERR
jgi:hypothetical protein